MSPRGVNDGHERGKRRYELDGRHGLAHVVRVDSGQGCQHQRDHMRWALAIKWTGVNETPKRLYGNMV